MKHPDLLTRPIRRKLHRLRRAIRAHLVVEAAAWALVGLAGVVFATWLCDWGLFRLTGRPVGLAQRAATLAAAALAAGWFAWRRGGRGLLMTVSDEDAAVIVEHRYPALADRLISAVQYAARPWRDDPSVSAALVARMAEQANEAAAGLDFLAPLNRRRLAGRVALAAAAVLLPAAAALAAPTMARIWFARNILLVDMSWRPDRMPPSDTYLALPGAPVVAVVRGRDLPVEVRVRRGSRVIPDRVVLHVRANGAEAVSEVVDREDGSLRYPTVLHRITEPATVWATADGARSPQRRIRVIEPAEVRGVRFTIEYPGYMRRPARQVDGAAGAVAAPPGSWITVEAAATKPLSEAGLLLDGEPVGRTEIRPVRLNGSSEPAAGLAGRFRLPLPVDGATTARLQFALADAEGFSGRAETSFLIHIQVDQPPELKVNWLALTKNITTRAIVPAAIEARDDCGLVELRGELTVAGVSTEPITAPIRRYESPVGAERIAEHKTDLADLGLHVGDVVRLAVAAVDTLPAEAEGPNIRRSQARVFNVVSDDDLRAQLLSEQKQMRLRMAKAMEAQAAARDLMKSAADQGRPGGAVAEARRLAAGSARRQQTAATFAASIAATYETILTIRENNRIDAPAQRQSVRERMHREIIDPLNALTAEPMPAALAAIDRAVEAAEPAEAMDAIAARQQQFYDALDAVKRTMTRLEGVDELTRMLSGVITVSEEVKTGVGRRLKARTGDLFDPGR